MLSYESGMIDKQREIIKLDINNLKGITYDLICEAFNEVLEQSGIDPSKVSHEEWTLTCKYFSEENANA